MKGEYNLAVRAAFDEIKKQVPSTVDCSKELDMTAVLIPDGVNLQLVIKAALKAARSD